MIKTYGNVRLMDIAADAIAPWDTEDATHLRVRMPASAKNEVEMQKNGFFLADRTLGVSINLVRSTINFDKLVRMQIVQSGEFRQDILRIAKESFPDDRRFHILPQPNSDIAARVLEEWVNDLNDCLIAMHKGNPVGFLALKEHGDSVRFIHLAAVEEKYRAAGAALSLYAYAAAWCKAQGMQRLEGRISSKNTAVMNLYAYLGGTFCEPEDIFLREVRAI